MKQSWFYIAPIVGAILGIIGISCLFIDGGEDYNTTGKYVIAAFGITSFFLIITINYSILYRSLVTNVLRKLSAYSQSSCVQKMG